MNIRRLSLVALVLLGPTGFAESSTACPGVEPPEIARAARTAARIDEEWPLISSGPVVDYVQSVGLKLARSAANLYRFAPGSWRFKVVRDRATTAFAIGGGRIYVSDGALKQSADESEFAAIVAHEIGHQLAGHFCRGYEDDEGQHLTTHLRVGSMRMTIDPARELEADRFAIQILLLSDEDPHAILRTATRVYRRQFDSRDQAWSEKHLKALETLLQDVPKQHPEDSRQFINAKRRLSKGR